jgi:hypothetical protein
MRAVVSAGTPRAPRLNDTTSCADRLGARLAAAAALAVVALGCSDDSERRLDPVSVAMPGDEAFAPVYSDDELTIYESKTSLMLPIIAPKPGQLEALNSDAADPFERLPWVEQNDVHVQVTWTLSNLDPDAHAVWVMIDPWNEFGRYAPALHMSDRGATRDLSGIDMLFEVPGTDDDAEPRIVGTFTFDDMDELAVDLATVFKILNDAVPVSADDEDPRATLVNNAFNVRDRSNRSPLLAPYRPSVVPGLVGFDYGVRTSEHANVALEIVVELRDDGDRVAERGQAVQLLEPPEAVISAGDAP